MNAVSNLFMLKCLDVLSVNSVMLRTYTHVTRQMQENAAEKMGNFMAQVM